LDIIIDRIVGPVAGGLIGGALLIVLLGLLYSKVFPNYPFAQTRFPDKTYFEMLKTTGELDEVKAFLAKYPAATTTVRQQDSGVSYSW